MSRRSAASAQPSLQCGPHLPVQFPFLNRPLFFVGPLALGQGNLDLDPPLLCEHHLGRDEGVAFFADLADEPLDLLAVEKKLFLPKGIVVENIGLFVRADVHMDKENLAVPDFGVAVLQADPALPDGFHLAAQQGDAIAQYVLGVMYQRGDGVKQDYVQAYAWLDQAAKQDLEAARRSREAAAAEMTADQLAKAQRLSNELARR